MMGLLGNILVASCWGYVRMKAAPKKPRWNHGLSHVGHVGHASPGDHHGIARRLDAGRYRAFVFVWLSEQADRKGCLMTIFIVCLGAALVVMMVGIGLAVSKDMMDLIDFACDSNNPIKVPGAYDVPLQRVGQEGSGSRISGRPRNPVPIGCGVTRHRQDQEDDRQLPRLLRHRSHPS